ncbi:GPI inositol-deacylase [Streptantibioticus rubrisoli]|uniref:GPI inositol-deacylase n=1 Tax=Streptantibioticus rubrisoli TaxID=1387313 RepID=A0ABT1P816_9ACTN|nr:GPI inositol-deacylase [Streptantibioticus rubrisoli]MCQ4041515.1 GPI inositol-deacylase [Streptantibioticus rubrisoli]
MSRIVLVHGIAQQVKGAESLLTDWFPALSDGLALAGGQVDRDDVAMAFYGDLFRPAGHRGLAVPELDASDVEDGIERELLLLWWESAARQETAVTGPEAAVRLRAPNVVQRALDALSHSSFFAGLSERLMISSARQVRRYFTEPETRARVKERLVREVTYETRVIVAHSLGSVVAYEALCAHPEWPDLTLVTLGSPLGVSNVVFDRLTPAPANGRARWPVPVKRWTNVADQGDAVALVKALAPAFGERVTDLLVHNGAKAHDVRPYLTAVETGRAVTAGLGA